MKIANSAFICTPAAYPSGIFLFSFATTFAITENVLSSVQTIYIILKTLINGISCLPGLFLLVLLMAAIKILFEEQALVGGTK
jgi:hypothetical protein